MSDELRINLAALQGLYADLVNVSVAFGDIENDTARAAGAVGQPVLATRVSEFSSTWDDRRTRIVESLDAMWMAAKAVEETFTEVDGKLASALQGAVQEA